MAFVSVRELSRSGNPKMTIRTNGQGDIAKSVLGDFDTLEIEIDIENKIIRLMTGFGLSKKLVGKAKRTFSVPGMVWKEIIPNGMTKFTLTLTLSQDGWWYGGYGHAQERG